MARKKQTKAGQVVNKTRPPSASEQIDRRLAAAALEKIRIGGRPAAQERAALVRIERAREEESRWEHYQSVPKGHYRQMAGGRQVKVLNEQAALYGIPIGGRTIDLTAVVKWIHDFLAARKHQLAAAEESGGPVSTPALERLREEKARLAQLDRLEREGQLLPRSDIHDGLVRIAGIIRKAGEALQRQFGPEAQQILNESFDDAQREIDCLFGGHVDAVD